MHNLKGKLQEVKNFDANNYPTDSERATGSSTQSSNPPRATGSSTQTSNTQRATGSSTQTSNTQPAKGSSTETSNPQPATGSNETSIPQQAAAVSLTKTSNIYNQKSGPCRLRGNFISPKHAAKSILLKHKLDITSDFRKSHKIHNRHDFRYYYADSNDLVKD